MFGRRKKPQLPSYDKTGKIPVIRSSICTGEQVAGFKDPASGKITQAPAEQQISVVNMMDALQMMLEQAKKKETPARKPQPRSKKATT